MPPLVSDRLLPLLASALLASACGHSVPPSAAGSGGFLCPDGITWASELDDCPTPDGPVTGEGEGEASEGEGEGPVAEGEGEGAPHLCEDGTAPDDGGYCPEDYVCPDGQARPAGGDCPLPVAPTPLVVVDVRPAAGPVEGGTRVTITGSGFVRPTSVTLGGVPIGIDPVRNAEELRFDTPCVTRECLEPTGLEPVLGPVSLEIANANGIVVLTEGFSYFDGIGIGDVTPASGPSAGGELVRITGTGFVEGAVATFGGRTAARTELLSPTELSAVTPAGSPGLVDVRVFTSNGQASADDAYSYFDRVVLDAVTPPFGPTTGGTVVTLQGSGFSGQALVAIGLEDAEVLGVGGDGLTITARVPGQEEGPRDVYVRDEHGDAVLAGGFAYFDPDSEAVRLFSVVPRSGSTEGGDSVLVVGANLGADAVVLFGGEAADCHRVDAHRFSCRTPRQDAEGPVDVSVESAAGHDVLANGFSYHSPLQVQQVNPASGPVGGGTRITIRGNGFSPETTVRVGVLPATGVNVLDSGTIFAFTPPGSAGPADIVLTRGERRAVARGAFAYTDSLRLLAVEPDEGAMAGGTFVTLLGTGFVPGSRVTFGGVAAERVNVLNGAAINAYTPPGTPGTVAVVLTTPAGESWTLDRGFTYFNPTTAYGGTWGGPIDGAVNVTVLDGSTGDGLPEAFVLLGLQADTPYQGLTDGRGQVTFSGPDVMGDQLVTASKEGYGAASVVEFDAENITVYLSPPPPPPSPGPMAGGPDPAEVSGLVWGLDKYLTPFANEAEGERAVAYISTTQETMWEDRRPDPGPGNIVFGDGEYTIRARLGDFAVIAMGGILKTDPETGQEIEFRPMRMGVHRFLFGITGELIEGADIELNVPLSDVASLRFDDPPVGVDSGAPSYMIIQPFLMFDAEGAWPIWEFVGYSGEPLEGGFDMVNMPPLVHGLVDTSFTIVSEVGTFNALSGEIGVPFADNYMREVTELADEILVTPWVGIPRLLRPEPGGAVAVLNRHVEWTVDGGSDPPNGQLLVFFVLAGDSFVPAWEMFVPGHITELDYPPLPNDPLAPGTIGALLFRPVWVDGLDIDNFEYGDYYYVDSYRAWSQDYDILMY